ncbi:DJ-1/PfpI family protein [Nocardia otitidiscaviarum]|uniref:DJ-1/PfpI family protein n=1 Tax=Nocardia otitidiscaviarum TaxID=1823 RepID=UPI001C8F759C|nr:DJ-1/PfpI family protein [Nocardia otitidiscaviarum]MCP9619045.1 DJ-1/PfpI family protein [Nocardia otitidiscaviarum]
MTDYSTLSTTSHPPRRTRRQVLRGSATLAAAGLATTFAATAQARPDGAGPEIGIVLYDGFSLLDPTGPAEVLSRIPGARVTMIAERRGPVRTDTGDVAVVAERARAEVDRLDVLLIPGAGNRGTTAAIRDSALLQWIRDIDATTTWTSAVCTGSVVLAATGLLDGHQATTYWASAPYLESTYPVSCLPHRYVHSGKFITAAGVSAGLDMALYLASLLTDEDTARAIQLAIEYNPKPPFDSGDPTRATTALRDRALAVLEQSQT